MSSSERSPIGVGDREANDLVHLAASLDALALLYHEPDADGADFGDGQGEVQVGEVVAMSIRCKATVAPPD
jgi:hypothetical protein